MGVFKFRSSVLLPFFFFFVVATFFCCSAIGSLRSPREEDGNSAKTINLATFNTATLSLIPLSQQRFSAFLGEVLKSTADVLCLQELWNEEDILAVVNVTKSSYPYHLRLATHSSNRPPCNATALGAALICGQTRCPNRTITALFLCAMEIGVCRQQMRALGQRCLNCLVNSKITDPAVYPLLCATDLSLSYSTTNGLLLLSKLPLSSSRTFNYTDLEGDVLVATRGYLASKVEHLGTVVCTHFPTYFGSSNSAYIGHRAYNSVQDEQDNAAQILFDHFPASLSDPVFLLGDFNHGPAIGETIAAEFPGVYQKFIEKGYTSPAVSQLKKCTYCRDNILVPDQSGVGTESNRSLNASGVLIDHVYARSKDALNVHKTERLFTSVLPFGVPLSDHYGISVAYLVEESADSVSVAAQIAAFNEWKNQFEEWKSNECS